ncbi:decapping and exoribonuclease protein [Strongylocentrotus purpuratus]|uniref:Decapping nuclease n=1 Tax=Strongylocentrotus purpuratus TaxID=7668 RepID=A0A7M7RCE6_STRPU|nr:decapping and exoribonuclease protein [Strongylocentrotus purpuratus]|eukprot:XP_783738.3 PREDICTED: decapping and exoribonuclease protein [Strongylocentrotus purpuratus]
MKRHRSGDTFAAKRTKVAANFGKEEAPRNQGGLQMIRPFPIKPISRFNQKFPFFRQPTEVGHFSLDSKRGVHCDARLLKVYCPPADPRRTDFDLRKGYRDYIKRDDDVKERLNNITKWMQENKRLIAAPPTSTSERSEDQGNESTSRHCERINADFVMWRGHMTKFLCTPYEDREGWAMAVTLYRGTYYISEVETEENRARRKGMSDREQEMSYWGYKFEQYVTSDDERSQPDTTKPVDTHEAFCSVIRTRLDSHSLLYSGEVDCRIPNSKKKPPENYMELKTTRIWYKHNNERNFYRFKLLKVWAQSFLVGIPEVIVGFRDDEGIVSYLRSFQTMQMASSSQGMWDAAVCFNFANQLLTYIKEIVTIDNPKVVYMLKRAPGSSEVTCTLHAEGDEQFLSQEYIASFR